MKIVITIDDNLDEAVKVDLMNKLWVDAQTATRGHFEAEHDGDRKLSQLANGEFDKWGKLRWKLRHADRPCPPSRSAGRTYPWERNRDVVTKFCLLAAIRSCPDAVGLVTECGCCVRRGLRLTWLGRLAAAPPGRLEPAPA
jgi:hypothetical protein